VLVTKVPAKGILVPERATTGRVQVIWVLVPETKVKALALATMVQVRGTWELVLESKAQGQVRAEPVRLLFFEHARL
jgi:hypothetical protein